MFRVSERGRRRCAVLEPLEPRTLLSFAAPVPYNIGTQPSPAVPNISEDGVATGDFNGDHKLDIAAVHSIDNTVNVLLNNGNGTFKTAVPYPTSNSSTVWVTVADVNTDGKADLVTLGTKNNTGSVSVLIGNGDGTFKAAVNYAAGPVARGGVAIGDFNGDAKPDLAIAQFGQVSPTQSGVDILINNGNGTFKPYTAIGVWPAARSVTVGDFNADGKDDLAVADGLGVNNTLDPTYPAGMTILLGNGNGTFATAGQYNSPNTPGDGTVNPEFITAADLNNDGKTDVVECNYDHNLNVFLGTGGGNFAQAVGYDTGEYPRAVAIADVNHDGKKDLVIGNVGNSAEPEPGSIAVMVGNGNGTFQSATQLTPFNYPGWVALGDFNGDGEPDIAASRVLDGHSVNVLMNQSPANAAPTIAIAAMASPNPVTGKTTKLQVLGADDTGESRLTYTWTTTGTPPAPVKFNINGTNAAKTVIATFAKAGTYRFVVTLTDPAGITATSSVIVTVNQSYSSVTISPTSASVQVNGSQQFTASARDQFGNALATQPAFTWKVSGGGTISSTGLFKAGATAGGPFTVTATSGAFSKTANVTVTSGTSHTVTLFSLPGDGRAALFNNTPGQAGWDAAHSATSATYVLYTNPQIYNFAGVFSSPTTTGITRGFLAFDTSALPANATITSVTVGLYVTSKSDAFNDGKDFLSVVQGFQGAASILSNSDYPKAGNAITGPTEVSNRVDLTNITTGGFVTWTLNTTGRNWITKGGITKLAMREGHDIQNAWPGTGGSTGNGIDVYMSEQTGTAQDPYLQITYTTP